MAKLLSGHNFVREASQLQFLRKVFRIAFPTQQEFSPLKVAPQGRFLTSDYRPTAENRLPTIFSGKLWRTSGT